MVAVYLYLVGTALLVCGITGIGEDVEMKSGISEASVPPFQQRQPFSIEHIDNVPEILVSLPGIDKPVCFNLDVKDETIRIIQDPKTGIVVNAQIVYNGVSNKTYIGAALVAKDNICVLARQDVVFVNNVRYNWGETRVLGIGDNRIVISQDTVIVAFRHCRISLVIQRHHDARENSMDFNELGREIFNRPTGSNASDSDGKDDAETENLPLALPVIGYAETESFINQLSSKRRRGLLLQKFFGINQDGAVVRNAIIELESNEMKKRGSVVGDSSSSPQDETVLSDAKEYPQEIHSPQHKLEKDKFESKQKEHQNIHRKRRESAQRDNHRGSRMEREAQRRDSTIFLDISITDSRDFSNKTHGLLGQFLTRNVTIEKIRYKGRNMTIRLLVQENPIRRTWAFNTTRPYAEKNASRECYKVRNQGKEMLDGKYSDYMIPTIWYRNMKELPPPAPL